MHVRGFSAVAYRSGHLPHEFLKLMLCTHALDAFPRKLYAAPFPSINNPMLVSLIQIIHIYGENHKNATARQSTGRGWLDELRILLVVRHTVRQSFVVAACYFGPYLVSKPVSCGVVDSRDGNISSELASDLLFGSIECSAGRTFRKVRR